MGQASSFSPVPEHCTYNWFRQHWATSDHDPRGAYQVFLERNQECAAWLAEATARAQNGSVICSPDLASVGKCKPNPASIAKLVTRVMSGMTTYFWIPFAFSFGAVLLTLLGIMACAHFHRRRLGRTRHRTEITHGPLHDNRIVFSPELEAAAVAADAAAAAKAVASVKSPRPSASMDLGENVSSLDGVVDEVYGHGIQRPRPRQGKVPKIDSGEGAEDRECANTPHVPDCIEEQCPETPKSPRRRPNRSALSLLEETSSEVGTANGHDEITSYNVRSRYASGSDMARGRSYHRTASA